MDKAILPDLDDSFFTTAEMQRFKDLAKKHLGLDLTDNEAFDHFHRLYRLIDDIVRVTRNGTIKI